MKKTGLFFIVLLLFSTLKAFAADSYEGVLNEEIKKYGIWDNEKGIIFADKVEFEEMSLLIVRVENNSVLCDVFNDTDGIQLTDTLILDYSDSLGRLLTVKSGGKDYIMLTSGGEDKFFTIKTDKFIQTSLSEYYPISAIAAMGNGQIKPLTPKENIYNFHNRLKEEVIAGYSLTNKIGQIREEDRESIIKILTAGADIMSFDIKNYDYDRLFKYVLLTHENFKILTDIDPKTSQSSIYGYNNVHLVSGDFIDYVMKSVFRITPEKPPINALISRGFCYNNGYYLYSGGFNTYFSTEIKELIAAYDLGGNVMYAVFSDIYTQGENKIYEYSYALLQKTGGGYSILRLGMGESLPLEGEIRAYSPFSAYGGSVWSTNGGGLSSTDNSQERGYLMIFCLAVISIGSTGIICCLVVIFKSRK